MIAELEWDSKFFRRKIGKLTEVPPENKLKKLIQQAYKFEYAYLTCRVIIEGMSKIQILEDHGFYMTDIGLMWEKKIDEILEPGILVRSATIKDAPMLKSMVRGLFKDSRFYNDPFFTCEEAERFYQTWIENMVRDREIETFLVEDSGFIICKKLSKNMGDIPLIGVISKAQGKGIGSSLMHRALKWFNENGMKTVTVRTQANNIKAMNFYAGLGFRIKYMDTTMGLILNRVGKEGL